ncbi:hypothetical protein L3081_20020 [Colwellia sp. MSW7]|uniref:Uncharacterized protein n=1 Tax=Colwellia maritima TaxID=2912588 RepID=A0ABS9X4S7_9GAMM|nr:hypothetical protein [Colwellia maritima]MCI2285245.1 hypothetical protein [Colwellia maritima]
MTKLTKYYIGVLMFGSIMLSSLASATDDQSAINRLVQLSTIPTQASIDEVIALGSEGSTNEMRQQYVFTALIRIGPSVSGDAYAKDILDMGTASAKNLQGALAYLSSHPENWMAPYVATYIQASQAGIIRSMAAYLAGRLNLTAQKNNILTIMADTTIADDRIHAALGLSHLITGAEFNTVIDSSSMRAWDKKLIHSYNDFNWANNEEKDKLVSTLYQRSETFLVLTAYEYLLKNDKIDLLKRLKIINDDNGNAAITYPPMQAVVRMLGYQTSGTFDAAQITKLALM